MGDAIFSIKISPLLPITKYQREHLTHIEERTPIMKKTAKTFFERWRTETSHTRKEIYYAAMAMPSHQC